MKKLLFAAAIAAAFTMPAQAGESDLNRLCQGLASLAESIMANRQSGVAMGKQLDILQDDDKALTTILSEIVVSAYEQPRWSMPELKQNVIGDFRDRWHVTCLSEMKTAMKPARRNY